MQEIAQTLNVTARTLRMWKVAHEEFAVALKRSKEVHDDMIEATLIMKANGYERKVQKATASGKVVTVNEYFPPSEAPSSSGCATGRVSCTGSSGTSTSSMAWRKGSYAS